MGAISPGSGARRTQAGAVSTRGHLGSGPAAWLRSRASPLDAAGLGALKRSESTALQVLPSPSHLNSFQQGPVCQAAGRSAWAAGGRARPAGQQPGVGEPAAGSAGCPGKRPSDGVSRRRAPGPTFKGRRKVCGGAGAREESRVGAAAASPLSARPRRSLRYLERGGAWESLCLLLAKRPMGGAGGRALRFFPFAFGKRPGQHARRGGAALAPGSRWPAGRRRAGRR